MGLIVALSVWLVSRSRPEDHSWCNEQERKLIHGDQGKPASSDNSDVGKPPIKEMAASWNIWLMCLAQWFTNVGWLFLVTYAPKYFEDVHHVPTELRGAMVAIPPLVGWGGMLVGGFVTDWMGKRYGVRWGRALPISLSRFVAMAAYLVCLFNLSPWLAVAMFSIVSFATNVGTPAMWAFNQDIGGRHVASVLGWGNMWGNLGATVTPPILVWAIGPDQNWNAAFLTCAAAFLLSGLAGIGIDARKQILANESGANE